eukprot:5447662-Pleurochrysis_carterae.AAC.1
MTKKFTTLSITPGLAPKLAHLSSLRCTHASHALQCESRRSADGGWLSYHAAAYQPDLNYHIAKAIASLRPPSDSALKDAPESSPPPLPIPVA